MIDTMNAITQRKIAIPDDLWRAVQVVARTDRESAASVVRRVLRADPSINSALLALRSTHAQ